MVQDRAERDAGIGLGRYIADRYDDAAVVISVRVPQ
jgi:hypothetical protein